MFGLDPLVEAHVALHRAENLQLWYDDHTIVRAPGPERLSISLDHPVGYVVPSECVTDMFDYSNKSVLGVLLLHHVKRLVPAAQV